jgi:hypothetical protein
MGLLAFPLLLLLVFGPGPKPSDQELSDVSRFSKAIGTAIALVDRDGTVREGLIAGVTADDLTMRFGSGSRAFPLVDIVSAERLRDGRKDGAIKGAIFGAVLGLIVVPFYETSGQKVGGVASMMALYSGIGWALDASQTNRELIYRSTTAPAGAVKVSLRF